MKRNTLVPLIIAVVCGLGATILITQIIKGSGEKKAKVYRFIKAVKEDDQLKEEELKNLLVVVEIPASEKAEGEKAGLHFPDPENPGDEAKLKNRFLRVSRSPGDVVHWEDLREVGEDPIQTKLKPGEESIAVRATLHNTGGFIKPGSHVNLVHVEKGEPRRILWDVEVLTVNERTGTKPGEQHVLINYANLKMDEKWKTEVMSKHAESGNLRLVLCPPLKARTPKKDAPGEFVALDEDLKNGKLTQTDVDLWTEKLDGEVKTKTEFEKEVKAAKAANATANATTGAGLSPETEALIKDLLGRVEAAEKKLTEVASGQGTGKTSDGMGGAVNPPPVTGTKPGSDHVTFAPINPEHGYEGKLYIPGRPPIAFKVPAKPKPEDRK